MVYYKNVVHERFAANSTHNDEEDFTAFVRFDVSRAKMSAPELPPISTARKTALINGYRRSNTFNSYKSTTESRNKRHSIHSDSALQAFAVGNSKSRTSSSSSVSTKNRVLSAGPHRQKLSAELPKEILSGFPVKTDSPTMRGKVLTEATPKFPTTQSQRTTSVKEMITSKRKIHPSTSYVIMTSRVGSTNGYVPIHRNSSDKSLTEMPKRNSKNMQNNGSVNHNNNHHKTGRRSQMNNINGLRKYSSTLGLDTKADKRSEEEVADDVEIFDSDSDTEKSQRVIQWIIGVNQVAEPPEEPRIEHVDEPPQRDTAIRIVYEGDS